MSRKRDGGSPRAEAAALPPPERAQLRPLREDDAEAVAAIFVESFGESRQVDAEEIRSWLANEELLPEWLRVLEEGGTVAGYGDIWPQGDVIELDVAAPGRWTVFLDWAEDEARRRGLHRVRASPPPAHELADICAARGYRPWRSSFTMEIDLVERPDGSVPSVFEVRTYRNEDAAVLLDAMNEAFSEDADWHTVTPSIFRDFYLRARGFDPALWLLAWDVDDLAGFSLAYLQRGGDPTRGWVGTLGVRAPWRRRGLGEALLRSSFAALHDRGLRRVALGVDSQNVTGALRLYERAGMHKAAQTDSWVLDLS
jgi:ribosomal protein S18 acetylase RimI-like enzyme